ncbi:hypothetical protein [Helicobacter marmotae]|uniref:Uncharacterized protein n=1 Tax=Helicobacter marmotae TaxID=152490 RepID=A0A3D8I408_9HELI|nr:hypothetical protein [Helicobacter marmotae]RDU59261.1 hypothetical protein CQA63_07390 [Helicobacter marmotae]
MKLLSKDCVSKPRFIAFEFRGQRVGKLYQSPATPYFCHILGLYARRISLIHQRLQSRFFTLKACWLTKWQIL